MRCVKLSMQWHLNSVVQGKSNVLNSLFSSEAHGKC